MALIIYAHPNKEGNCGRILKHCFRELKIKRIDYELLDLYHEKYDPRLQNKEHYTSGKYFISKQNKEIQKKIKENKLLIFIYPIWWGGMPAILKGFFDRVFTSKFAFKYIKGIPIGLLNNEAIIMSTSGGPGFYYKLINKRPEKAIRKDILRFCGIKSKFNLLSYSNKVHSENQIKSFVKKSLKSL